MLWVARLPWQGTPTVEPVYHGIDAVWILENEKLEAEINGFTVVDAPSVLVTHLADVLKRYILS